MTGSRRHFLQRCIILSAAARLSLWSSGSQAQAADMQQRISDIIREYSEQGIHRTGTEVDKLSAHWLRDRLLAMGIEADLDAFPIERIEIEEGRLSAPQFSVDGVPLYDCHYTNEDGVTGVMSLLAADVPASYAPADIGVVVIPTGSISPQHTLLDNARRHGAFKAILVVSEGLINAEDFRDPIGPPVLQVTHARWQEIQALIASREPVTLIARARREPAVAFNVSARIAGRRADLPPMVVMTPRSGWWQSASERGGGIAAFLEIARIFSLNQPLRDVLLTANTGHELGHLGLDQYLHNNPELIRQASVWLHLGANFAARASQIRLQYSDYELAELTESVLDRHRLQAAVETPTGTRPLGEARNIFDGGGHFVSLLGSNPLFHQEADVWPDAVDIDLTSRWVRAFTELATEMATS